MNFKYSLLAGAVLSAVSVSSHAADGADGEVTKVIVTANPFHQGETEQILLPAKVLSGDELRDKMANSLGETLSSELGVSSSALMNRWARTSSPAPGLLSIAVVSGDLSPVPIGSP